jgi:hypothetical protein
MPKLRAIARRSPAQQGKSNPRKRTQNWIKLGGNVKSIDKIVSHNDLLSCASDIADNHGLNLLQGLQYQPLLPLPKMFHSVPEPYLEPQITDKSRIFYIGINWERLGRPKGRFHDALTALDSKDLVDIYGPELVHGVAPWAGFKSYRGELPFDGEAVKYAINQAGVCLALSSEAHKQAGIMSNRLFEGLAGGAAIIASPNVLIDKYFKDIVYFVDDTRGEAVLQQQVIEAMRKIRRNPEEAIRRTLEGQRIMREHCALEGSLRQIADNHARRAAHYESIAFRQGDITVICNLYNADADVFQAHMAQLASQSHCDITLHLICDTSSPNLDSKQLEFLRQGSVKSVTLHRLDYNPVPDRFDGPLLTRQRCGPLISSILKSMQTEYFAFVRIDDVLFSDHFTCLFKSLEGAPGAMAAASGMLTQTRSADGSRQRVFDSARFVDLDSIVLVTGSHQLGRFVFRSELLDDRYNLLLQMLDGEEHNYFRLAALLSGPLAQSCKATYVHDSALTAHVPFPVEPVEHQRQYIRDLFARDPKWLDRLDKGVKIPEFVYARGPAAPISWDQYVSPRGMTQLIKIDHWVATNRGGEGIKYLVDGFSQAEDKYIWLQADRGIIEFRLTEEAPGSPFPPDYQFAFVAAGRNAVENGRPQHCTIAVNGMVVAYMQIPESATEFRVAIPSRLVTNRLAYRIEFVPDHADVVFDETGAVADPRRLSLRIMRLAMLRKITAKQPLFAVGEIHACTATGRGAEALIRNFYTPESKFTWIAGAKGYVRFGLLQSTRAPRLLLGLSGRTSLQTKIGQVAKIRVNDIDCGEHPLSSAGKTVSIDLAAHGIFDRLLNVEISARHAEAVFDEMHNIVDHRLLGIAIHSLGVIDDDEGQDAANDEEKVAEYVAEPTVDEAEVRNEEGDAEMTNDGEHDNKDRADESTEGEKIRDGKENAEAPVASKAVSKKIVKGETER